jgi:hypothetical protein
MVGTKVYLDFAGHLCCWRYAISKMTFLDIAFYMNDFESALTDYRDLDFKGLRIIQ